MNGLKSCMLSICAVVLILGGLPFNSFAQPTIRVLLVDTKNARIPQKDEKVEQIGTAKGEVILSGVKYYGDLQVWKGEKGIYVISEIALEDYVKGVVAAEVGGSWEIEALKAQAVASRTYALYQRLIAVTSNMRYHLTSNVMHQAYKPGNISPNIVKAVEETKGQVLMYGGSPIVAFYHSTSVGMTEDPVDVFGKTFPYLKSVETNCKLSPYYLWVKRIPAAGIEKALDVPGLKDIVIDSYTASNRVRVFKLITETGEVEVSGYDFRKNMGWDELPSTMITDITKDGDIYIFDGKGYGHGVGMCQWSALEMAKDGKSYKDILSTFYPGAAIEVYEDR
ncbi:MAG: SpoIID/LytB domain-containing protein [Nitrospirae bacterium]|nr:SpoIID/LytB domain-containing protein [Nitrospirota bacterium]